MAATVILASLAVSPASSTAYQLAEIVVVALTLALLYGILREALPALSFPQGLVAILAVVIVAVVSCLFWSPLSPSLSLLPLPVSTPSA